jgi:hypothetical protein
VRVLVTGSRDWTDGAAIREALRPYSGEPYRTLMHGGCQGADKLAAIEAKKLGWRVVAYPADWRLGPKAGPERNQRMVDVGADLCLAFPLPGSRGTYDCAARARRAGIPVVFARHPLLDVDEVDSAFAEAVRRLG